MHASSALITVNDLGPAKLMGRLAKHWSHKFAVELDEKRAVIPFPAARCVLQVQGAQLLATIEVDDPATLPTMQDVVADHLQRMARGEALSIEWRTLPG